MGKLKRKCLNVKKKYQIQLYVSNAFQVNLKSEKTQTIACFPYLGNTALINLEKQLNQKSLDTTV